MQETRGHDDDVATLEQGVGGGVAEPVDLVVPRRVLLDVRVAPGQVRLGLVVVEVADEVLDGVLREELAELRVELRGKRLVVGQDQRRLVVVGDRPGERVGVVHDEPAEPGEERFRACDRQIVDIPISSRQSLHGGDFSPPAGKQTPKRVERIEDLWPAVLRSVVELFECGHHGLRGRASQPTSIKLDERDRRPGDAGHPCKIALRHAACQTCRPNVLPAAGTVSTFPPRDVPRAARSWRDFLGHTKPTHRSKASRSSRPRIATRQ